MIRRGIQISTGFALAAFCLCVAIPLAARDWTVGAPPADFPFITPALAAAADGDTIRVAPGVYREDLRLDHRVALLGDGHPTLIGLGRGTVIRVSAPSIVA